MCSSDTMTKLTPEEYHNFSQAIRDPQFPTMFEEYLKETSDPAARNEKLEYMRSLEASGEIPEGKMLIHPEPWICIETRFLEKTNSRIFLNILSSSDIADSKVVSSSASVPFIVSAPQLETVEGSLCVNVDAVIGQGTVAEATKKGNKMIVLIADLIVNHLNDNYLKKQSKISRDFRLRREWKYRENLTCILPVLVPRKDHTPAIRPKKPLTTYKILRSTGDEKKVAKIIVSLPPTVKVARDIDIDDTSGSGIRVCVSGETLVDIPLDFKVEKGSGSAQFDKRTQELTITY
jgi:hypothetical protein